MNKEEERKLEIYWYWFNHKQERTDTKEIAAKFRTTEDNLINIISWGLKFSQMKRLEEERIKAPEQEPSFVRDYNPEEEMFNFEHPEIIEPQELKITKEENEKLQTSYKILEDFGYKTIK
jgi:transcription initiation factor TFIIIB Brf1 subunit/transcription initiation factor TFIIB